MSKNVVIGIGSIVLLRQSPSIIFQQIHQHHPNKIEQINKDASLTVLNDDTSFFCDDIYNRHYQRIKEEPGSSIGLVGSFFRDFSGDLFSSVTDLVPDITRYVEILKTSPDVIVLDDELRIWTDIDM